MKRITLLVAFTVLGTVASAHEDASLSLLQDGVIPELLSAYSQTRLHVTFSEGDAGALQQLTFVSSGRETSVQPCLLRLVPKGSFRQLSLSGSWFLPESPSHLPHYVSVRFLDSLSQRGWSGQPPGVYFLFSLRDASLLEVTQVVPVPEQAAGRYQDIRLSNGCPAPTSP
jgi:hypothetical protein